MKSKNENSFDEIVFTSPVVIINFKYLSLHLFLLLIRIHRLFHSYLFTKMQPSLLKFPSSKNYSTVFCFLTFIYHFFLFYFDFYFHLLNYFSFHNRSHVRPVLDVLLTDKDRDVQYFASESLKICP